MAAGAQLVKIVERRAGDCIRACAEARSGNSLHVSAAGLPQDRWLVPRWAKATRRGGGRRGGWRWRMKGVFVRDLGVRRR